MNSLITNNTWELVPRPKKQKLVKCKWLFKIKEGTLPTDPLRFKARLVAKGFTQREGIDYTEIFSHVVKFKTIRMILTIVVQYDLKLEQLDVKIAFLHGDLDKLIYMEQHVGYVNKHYHDYVCLLKKSLYGLKQSPIQWYKKFDNFVTGIGFIGVNMTIACTLSSQISLSICCYMLMTFC